MIRKEMKYILLIAEEGKILQSINDLTICSKKVHLGFNDSPKNWQEIDIKDIPKIKELKITKS